MDHSRWMIAMIPAVMLSAGMVAAGTPVNSVTPRVENEIAYASGGVGDEQIDSMQSIGAGYNLSLTFAAAQSGDYLADVHVTIETRDHYKLVDTTAQGPLFYAQLPAGRYRISAQYKGVEQVRFLEIADGRPNRYVLYWKDSPDASGNDGVTGNPGERGT